MEVSCLRIVSLVPGWKIRCLTLFGPYKNNSCELWMVVAALTLCALLVWFLASNSFSGKALRLFDELKDEREVAVCHFYMVPWVCSALQAFRSASQLFHLHFPVSHAIYSICCKDWMPLCQLQACQASGSLVMFGISTRNH